MACGEEARAAFNAERRGDFLLKSDIPMPDADLRTLCSKPDDEFGIRMEAIGKDCECHLGGGPLTVQRLNRQGTLHRLFLLIDREGSRRILRVPLFDSGYFECLMRLEAVTSTYVRARKIRAPEIQLIELRVGGGSRTCHLVEVMEGIPVASVDDDELMCVRLLAEICDVLRRIHAIEAQGFGPLSLYPRCNEIECDERAIFRGVHASWADFITVRLDDHLSTCERIGAISGAEAALTGKVFSGSGSLLRNVTKAAVLHGDPGSHNFITRESAITGVLDWEDCLVGDPAYDVANLATFHPPRRLAAIVAAYGLDASRDDSELRRFWLYFLRIAIAKTVHRHRFGYVDMPGRFPAAGRIQLALRELANSTGVRPS